MPFTSKAQQRAAFSGYLGPEMQRKAKAWAEDTPHLKTLPARAASGVFPKRGPTPPQMGGVPGLMATRNRLRADRAAAMPKTRRSR